MIDLMERKAQRFTTSVMLCAVLTLAAALRFANLHALGIGSPYYTAAVKSMLVSPSNFYLIAAEPGGSVSVDKPPLGLWIQAINAMALGVNGLAVIFPQAAAGLVCVAVVYRLGRQAAGQSAGLIAALAQATSPMAVGIERGNALEATLMLALLLAAWAYLRAAGTGRLRWAILGGVLVGIGFNIKMMQAFLPLPAFYALMLSGEKIGLRHKGAHLAASSLAIAAVALAWPVTVDLTPADQRPYVGGSTRNSVFDLMAGYNGINRLVGNSGAETVIERVGQGNVAFVGEIGTAGPLRLIAGPLGDEIGWLLPFGLIAAVVLAINPPIRRPISKTHQAVILFGGWLLTEVIFFSVARFFHAYYMNMLVPPLSALVGMGIAGLWQMPQSRGGLALAALGLATATLQVWIASQTVEQLGWVIPALALIAAGVWLAVSGRWKAAEERAAASVTSITLGMLFIPAVWAILITASAGDYRGLYAFVGDRQNHSGSLAAPVPSFGLFTPGQVHEEMLAYLEANTQHTEYLMAVPSTMHGSFYILRTGRPVLIMGGFTGDDPVIDAGGLARLVEQGRLRYVLWGSDRREPNFWRIEDWVLSMCAPVSELSPAEHKMGDFLLYDCAR